MNVGSLLSIVPLFVMLSNKVMTALISSCEFSQNRCSVFSRQHNGSVHTVQRMLCVTSIVLRGRCLWIRHGFPWGVYLVNSFAIGASPIMRFFLICSFVHLWYCEYRCRNNCVFQWMIGSQCYMYDDQQYVIQCDTQSLVWRKWLNCHSYDFVFF